jgi:hypothetical protein
MPKVTGNYSGRNKYSGWQFRRKFKMFKITFSKCSKQKTGGSRLHDSQAKISENVVCVMGKIFHLLM